MNHFSKLLKIGGIAALLTATPVFAHTKLVASTPAANARLKASPRTITLTFNESVVPAFSKFVLSMPEHGNAKVPIRTRVSGDGKSITGAPTRPLAKGSYRITWTAASGDGHKMTGRVSFRIG